MVRRRTIADVLVQIESLCAAAPRQRLHLRTAPVEGGLVIDIGDTTGRVIVVTTQGWEVRDPGSGSPLFRRTDQVHPLPTPEPGGSLEELRALLNVTHDTWPLVLGWLIAAPFGGISRPWLFNTGPQGSGKSDAGRIIASVWDPREALTSPPRWNDRGDPAALAANSYILGYDNLSTISAEFSDWLCSVVTGAVDNRRVLHTTATMLVMSFIRTGVLTGITLGSVRPDLLERLVHVEFDVIEGHQRKYHADIMRAFGQAHGRILGALLDAVCLALTNLRRAKAEGLVVPRMSDYAALLRAYDLGTGTTDLFGAYTGAVSDRLREQAEDDPFCQVVLSHVRQHGEVEMPPAELYRALSEHRRSMLGQDEDGYWPNSPRSFGWAMRKAVADLREAGVSARQRKTNGHKRWVLTPRGERAPPAATERPPTPSQPRTGDNAASPGEQVAQDNPVSVPGNTTPRAETPLPGAETPLPEHAAELRLSGVSAVRGVSPQEVPREENRNNKRAVNQLSPPQEDAQPTARTPLPAETTLIGAGLPETFAVDLRAADPTYKPLTCWPSGWRNTDPFTAPQED